MTDFVLLHLGAVLKLCASSFNLFLCYWQFYFSKRVQLRRNGGGPNSREDITNPAGVPCTSAPNSHQRVGNLHIPVAESKCSQFPSISSSSVWACEFPTNVWPDKEQSCFTSIAATNCKHRQEAAHTSSWGWEVWFRVQRWGLRPHTSSRVIPSCLFIPSLLSVLLSEVRQNVQVSFPKFLISCIPAKSISTCSCPSKDCIQALLLAFQTHCSPTLLVSSEPTHLTPTCLHLWSKCPFVPVCDFPWAGGFPSQLWVNFQMWTSQGYNKTREQGVKCCKAFWEGCK